MPTAQFVFNPRKTAFSSSCVIATRGKAMLPTLPQKGAAFIPPKMPVPPSGPSKQHNSVPRLRFIPAKVVYGSKRLVPSGANPLHH
ncbi:hypothetical protein IEQ34_025032 [Dendrobium chrysotoxum]|uniref:Uncharacterized protein n=1 Tax=Dendrobium chrysotoxum TaxID=161865 RepID=A0AAV7FJ66_DENCH|nr:hypothetical protein IEQ34_025032 [Dendrobium chrysotoxum]